MEFNLPSEYTAGSSELNNNSSDDSQLVLALKKMLKTKLDVMVVRADEQVIGRVVEDLRSKVKLEIQSAVEKLVPGRNRNYADEIDATKERTLQLKFLDEVSLEVLTGKSIEAKGGTQIRVALLDETTGHIVHNRPEASAKVEILVLKASTDDDNECNWSLEEFNERIIRDDDKERPHFTKSQYLYLKEGISFLVDVKLGQDSSWTKKCLCRLGARIAGSFLDVKVKEAWSGSFMVKDSRSNLNKKRYPPILLDELWKLKNIGKDGIPCKRLNTAKVLTVQDFLFLHHVDTQQLEEIADVRGQKWKATVNHAQTCVIDDNKSYVYCPSSSKPEEGVVFDVVGRMKGIIREAHYVPVNKISKAEKAFHHNLLLSAFNNREDITSFDDETSLLNQFPNPSSETADRNNTRGADPCDTDPTIVESTTYVHDPCDTDPINIAFFRESDMGEPYEPVLEDTNQVQWSLYPDLDHFLENFGDNEKFMALILRENIGLSEKLRLETHPWEQSKTGSIYWVRTLAVMLWVLRARKRGMGQGDHNRVSKKPKIVTDCMYT